MRLLLFLVCALLLLAPISSVFAKDGSDDDVDQGDSDTRQRKQDFINKSAVKDRTIKIEGGNNDNFLGVRLFSKSADNKDMIRFQIKTGPLRGVETMFQYWNKTSVAGDDSSDKDQDDKLSKFAFRLRATYLVEYTTNGNSDVDPIWNGTNSNIVQAIRIGSGGWNRIRYNLDASRVFTANVTSADGLFGVYVKTAAIPTPVYGRNLTTGQNTTITTLTPNSVKMDFKITNFPWKASAGTSQLALVSNFYAGGLTVSRTSDNSALSESKKNVTLNIDNISATDAVKQAALWWQPTITAVKNGTITLAKIRSLPWSEVRTGDFDTPTRSGGDDDTPLSGWRRTVFVINTNNVQFDSFVWDPEVGVGVNDVAAASGNNGNNANIHAPSSIIMMIVLAIVAALTF